MTDRKSEMKINTDPLMGPDFFKKLCDEMKIGIVVSDSNGYLLYMNPTYAESLQLVKPLDFYIGKHVTEMNPNTRMHIVAQTAQAEINWPHEFHGESLLVHRIPIKESGNLIAVLGLVLFTNAEHVNELAEKLSFLQSKLKYYEDELESLRSKQSAIDSIIGNSEQVKIAKQEAIKAGTNQLPVFISGESGTGKELLAQAVHESSSRGHFPFIKVNCAAIPRELFESELFGYEKGAFTGANTKGKIGKFELAHRGTIFLDEIGDLPLEMQPKLLRILELKEFERVGGNRRIHSDFRIITATNKNIPDMIKSGAYRLDLYYRLNVIPLSIPPLRERREDILLLANYFIKQSKQQIEHRQDIVIDDTASSALVSYDWPGNAREVINTVERVLASMEGNIVKASDLPYHIQSFKQDRKKYQHASLNEFLQDAERKVIKQVLNLNGWKIGVTAERLGIHRTLLYKKMKKLNITSDVDT